VVVDLLLGRLLVYLDRPTSIWHRTLRHHQFHRQRMVLESQLIPLEEDQSHQQFHPHRIRTIPREVRPDMNQPRMDMDTHHNLPRLCRWLAMSASIIRITYEDRIRSLICMDHIFRWIRIMLIHMEQHSLHPPFLPNQYIIISIHWQVLHLLGLEGLRTSTLRPITPNLIPHCILQQIAILMLILIQTLTTVNSRIKLCHKLLNSISKLKIMRITIVLAILRTTLQNLVCRRFPYLLEEEEYPLLLEDSPVHQILMGITLEVRLQEHHLHTGLLLLQDDLPRLRQDPHLLLYRLILMQFWGEAPWVPPLSVCLTIEQTVFLALQALDLGLIIQPHRPKILTFRSKMSHLKECFSINEAFQVFAHLLSCFLLCFSFSVLSWMVCQS
jgi:hypothetical protein